jgi:hypothetical protein
MEERTKPQGDREEGQAPLPEKEPVFYYSRDHRLAKASPRVQELNNPKEQKRSGVFGTFTSTRSNTVLLVSIVGFCIVISFISKLTREKSTPHLGGNAIYASASRMGAETTYLTIRKTFKKETNVYTGAVDVAITPLLSKETQGDAPITTQRIFFTLKPEEEYGLSLPFEAATLLILMKSENEHITVRVKPK